MTHSPPLDPARLAQARLAWLDDLRRAHALQASATTALQLAQGEWRCGEYAEALRHFVEARGRAPEAAATHLAVINAAVMLARPELEQAALDAALRLHPHDPGLALHTARRRVPGDLEGARACLAPHLQHPLCGEFDDALACLAGVAPLPPADGDESRAARLQSLAWALRHGAGPQVLVGMPTDVLLRALTAAPADGLTLECGVYFGRSLQIIAERSPGDVHGFDSFQGLPEAWNANEGAGAYTTAGRRPRVAANVQLHGGWFEDTLPAFFDAHPGPIRLLHVDCDLYSSTCTVLRTAGPRLVPGSVIVFDDLLGYPGYERHELRAFEEYAQATGLRWEPVAVCLLGREAAIRVVSS